MIPFKYIQGEVAYNSKANCEESWAHDSKILMETKTKNVSLVFGSPMPTDDRACPILPTPNGHAHRKDVSTSILQPAAFKI